MRPFLARRQHNSPVFYIGVQGIACPNIESAAKWAWKNDLPFRRNFGLHGKTILPARLFFRSSSSLRTLRTIRPRPPAPAKESPAVDAWPGGDDQFSLCPAVAGFAPDA